MILTKEKIKSVDIDSLIKEKTESGRLSEILLIVPTNRKLRSLKKELISNSPNRSAGKINIDTIGTFASQLLFLDTDRGRILSEAAASVLLKQSFSECFNTGKIKYFSPYKNEVPEGTLVRVLNVISEYKRHGITPDQLRRETEVLHGSEKLKAADIAAVYEVYLKRCGALSVMDIGDVYRELNRMRTEEFAENFRKIFPSVDLVVINGFDEFTIPEVDIINSAAGVNGITLFLVFDYYDGNALIFSHLDKCYRDLTARGFTAIVDKSAAGYPFKSYIMRHLFSADGTEERENFFKNGINGFTKIDASSREKEIELIAKEIKYLLVRGEAEPDQCCVAFNLIKSYSPLVRDIFTAYGLPFNLTDRLSLSTSQPVISVINFLEILENDFYYKNIFRALSGGHLKIDGMNLSYLLKASVDLKIISGFENWRYSLKKSILEKNKEEENPEKHEVLRKIYNKALMDIEKLYRYLKPFDQKMTLNEFYGKLHDLVYNMDLPSALINNPGGSEEENIRGVTVFLETLQEIILMLEKEYGKQSRMALKFFLNNLRTMMNSARFNVSEKPGFGVQVTTVNEIRGLQFDYLFIAGLCDGDFPTRYTPEIFFSGSSRAKRNEINHQIEERYMFYQALCCWRRKLYLSFPRKDERKELAASNFISEFGSLFPLQVKTEDDYSAAVFSKEELLIYSGSKGTDKEEIFIKDFPGLNTEHVERGIKIDKIRRESPFGDSEYTGSIYNKLSHSAKEELQSLKNREYSISQLETFALCPYRYFAERILMLKEAEEPTEEIEAIEMGSILHTILYEFYKELRSREIVLQQSDDRQFTEAEELLFNIAEENIEKAGFSSPLAFFEKEKILGINGDRKNSILYKFLEQEKKFEAGYVPEFLEVIFSSMSKEIPVGTQPVTDIKVRGKIDRIDVNRTKNSLRIIDYKSGGRKVKDQELLNGISLQLPLYLYAAKHLINAQMNKDFNMEAGIYSLKFRKDNFGYSEITADTPEKLIVICLEAVTKYVEKIVRGEFNLSGLKDRESRACRYCSFKSVCRIREVS